MSDNIDYFIRGAIFVLTIIGAIVATIMFMTLEPVNIFARIMLSILSWIAGLCFLGFMRCI